MLRVLINICNEGATLEMGDANGKVWGCYSLVGGKADSIVDLLADIVNTIDPIIGDKFTMRDAEPKKKRKKKGKNNEDK